MARICPYTLHRSLITKFCLKSEIQLDMMENATKMNDEVPEISGVCTKTCEVVNFHRPWDSTLPSSNHTSVAFGLVPSPGHTSLVAGLVPSSNYPSVADGLVQSSNYPSVRAGLVPSTGHTSVGAELVPSIGFHLLVIILLSFIFRFHPLVTNNFLLG